MTFEEFLKKKKIDPVQLMMAERDLFFEFESHFNQMGDKSFEYSKKFWFNKLRRAHPLKDEPKSVKTEETNHAKIAPDPPKPAESIAKIAAATNPIPAFKPRFKAQSPATNAEESTDKNESPNPTPPPAFKPRFRTPTPVVKVEEKENEVKIEISAKPAGFKPRFKASLNPVAAKSESAEIIKALSEGDKKEITEGQAEAANVASAPSETKPAEEQAVKPAYKPRFKPSMVKKNPEE